MKKISEVKTIALGAFAAIGIMCCSSNVRADDVHVDKVVTGECGFNINISENIDYDRFVDLSAYVVKFVPEKSGVYQFDFDTNVIDVKDDFIKPEAFFYDDEFYNMGEAHINLGENRKDNLYVVKDHVYYLVYTKPSVVNKYTSECNIKYCGENNYKANLLCNNESLATLNAIEGVKFDVDKMKLELNNYQGGKFEFEDVAYVPYVVNSEVGIFNHYTAKDYLNNNGSIKVVVKGNNIITANGDERTAFAANDGISFEFVGDGTLECKEGEVDSRYTWFSSKANSIYSEKNIIVDGPTIKSTSIYAQNDFTLKSGTVDNFGTFMIDGNINFLGGIVVCNKNESNEYLCYINARTCSIEGTEFNLELSDYNNIFDVYKLYMKNGNVNVKLNPSYNENFGVDYYEGYANVFDAYDADITGGNVTVDYLKRDENDNTDDYYRGLNAVIEFKNSCNVSNANITIIGDKSVIDNVSEEINIYNKPQEFAIFKNIESEDKAVVNKDTVKITLKDRDKVEEVDDNPANTNENNNTNNDSNTNNDTTINENVNVNETVNENVAVKENTNVSDKKDEVLSEITDGSLIYKVTKLATSDGKTASEVTVVGVKKKSLKKVTIKSTVTINGVKYNVTAIGKKAFKKCKKLKKIVIKSKHIKKFAKGAFKGLKKSCVIKVPKSMKKVYAKKIKKAGFKGIVR